MVHQLKAVGRRLVSQRDSELEISAELRSSPGEKTTLTIHVVREGKRSALVLGPENELLTVTHGQTKGKTLDIADSVMNTFPDLLDD